MGNEQVSEDDLPLSFSIDDINIMLGHISIDSVSYDDWLSVGMAIHSEYDDDRGLSCWDNWSNWVRGISSMSVLSGWRGFGQATAIKLQWEH